MKLNLGAGKKPLKGYVNIDKNNFKGVDLVWNLDNFPYPFKNNSVDEIVAENILEFVENFMKTIEEIYRICKPGAKIKIIYVPCPSPFSFQNPLVVTRMGFNTFEYYLSDEGTESYLFKPKFKILKRKYIFSANKYLRWISSIVNIFPRVYTRFLFNIFYSNYIYIELEVVK